MMRRYDVCDVAPYAGAWIEIFREPPAKRPTVVAPYAGAWIEIQQRIPISAGGKVAPYAGAWIEIGLYA